MTKYSVIMPAYNSSKTIRRSIESVINQTYTDWELLIVDDGSTDITHNIVEEYQNDDCKIRYVFQSNKGPGIARNNGISKAYGEYICFLDSDDYWDVDFLSLVNHEIEYKKADVVYYDFIHEDKNFRHLFISSQSKFMSFSKSDILGYQMTGLFAWGMVKVIKRSLIVDNDLGFSDDLVGEEAIFSFDVLRLCSVYSFIDKPIYHYVDNDFGQHKKGDLDPWFEMANKMQQHLLFHSYMNDYRIPFQSLVAKALVISCYRISIANSLFNAIKLMKEKKNEYYRSFSIDRCRCDYVEKKTKVIFFLIRIGFFLPIYFASVLRK